VVTRCCTEVRLTLRWREVDSNLWSRCDECACELQTVGGHSELPVALASFGAMPNQLPLSPARVWHMSSAKQSRRGEPRYRPVVPNRIDNSWSPSPGDDAITLLAVAACRRPAEVSVPVTGTTFRTVTSRRRFLIGGLGSASFRHK